MKNCQFYRLRFALRLAVASTVAICAVAANAAPWFDAGVSAYESWPDDGTDKVLVGVGTWSGTDSARLVVGGDGGVRLKVEAGGPAPLGFDAAVTKQIAADRPSVSTTVRFSGSDDAPLLDPADKAMVTVSAVDGVARYFGLGFDPAGGTNVLHALEGPEPDENADVLLGFAFKVEGGATYIKYTIDGIPLTLAGSEWILTSLDSGGESVSSVCYAGIGDVVSLAGDVGSDEPSATRTLTIPALEHVVVESVKVAGADIASDGRGNYVVEQGSVVTVTFMPDPCWALDVASMTFVVNDDMTLPETGRPTPVNVAAAVTINEVMAKNGSTLSTERGFEGLDWVELRNSGEDDVDLTGWYMGNDPTKKPSKWPRIEGRCVVPAKGYKIVWFDGDALNADWAPDEAHVGANISTDADKHTVFLASAAATSAVVQQVRMPGGVKDVSYGRGHLSRTLVSSVSPAEYRVGGGWTPVSGPVGMSAAAGGFTVVSYQIDRDVGNMDVVDACLLDPSTWKAGYPATNTTQTLAFAGSGSSPSFDLSLYSSFPGGVSGDNFICVATATIQIPETGDWSFDVGSDDGFSASLTRLDRKWGWESRGSRGYGHSTATFNLEAGAYEVEVRYFNAGGGYVMDFSAAKGRTGFDAGKFSLVGTGDVVHAGALGAQVAADVSGEMVGKSKTLEWKTTFALDESPVAADGFRLLVRYADGFSARVNGTSVASVAASSPRSAAEALRAEEFAVDPSLVVKGVNTLEITAENDAVGDTEFYLSAELVHDMSEDLYVYFPAPTPGAANTGSGRTGFTPKVAFGEPHGWKDAAFDLELSCPDRATAVIYYTLDGTSPVIGAPKTFRYTAPFRVDRTTVVRAAVPDVDSILQIDASATYLFYDDVIAQDASVPEGFPADMAVNSQRMLYGFDKAVTLGDADTRERLRRGLTENTRTVSLVIDPKNLFDGASGIYVNASGNGRIWERQTMVEQINPMDREDEFSVSAGLRIRGAVSRGSGFAKHSFRLFFRSEYGMGTLVHPLFGDEGAGEFEKIDLRTSQNHSWAHDEDGDTFIHECFSRDSEGAMGTTYNRSRYYHLFINGVYWGLYQTEERVDQNYAESYNGGTAESYDVVRTSQPGYNTGVVEGETSAWTEFWRITTQEGYGEEHEANYNRVLGLNPDGTRNPDYPVLLNVTNLVEHLLSVHFAEDADAPVNSGGWANNLIAFRNRNDGEGREDGFLWNRHDSEHSLGFGGGASQVKSLIWSTPEQPNPDPNRNMRVIGNFNPTLLNYELMANAEYRRIFGDLVHRHMIKVGGALTAPVAEARYRARMAEIDDAVVAESARWGYKYGTKRNRQSWLNSCNDRINFINQRLTYLIAEYKRRGWYPSVDAPSALDGAGAPVADGQTVGAEGMLYLTGSGAGTVYYTTDGRDPRGADGAPSAAAVEYSGASPVPVYVPVIAKGDVWKYFDEGYRPASNWAAPDCADTAWKSGASRLGFGGGSFATTLGRYVGGGSSGTQVVTYYFRRKFTMPAGAASMTALKASLDCDDGYIAYINGVEVGRDQVGSTDYGAFATGINMGERDAVWTFPAGTLAEGENVIAVEVHQCNANSSDAWWNLELSYARAGNVEGGISVPSGGLSICARVLDGSGEWSALSEISVKGAIPQDGVADGLRIAEAMTSAPDDSGDFLVVTNVASGAISLDGVKIVAWNAKKKSEADPSLTYVFEAGTSLQPGEALKIGASSFPAGAKLTNSQVGLRIYAADGETLVQDVFLDADWWNGACDGTGCWFAALDFGREAKDVSQWACSRPAPQVPTIEDGTEVGTVDGNAATIDAALAGAGTQIFIPAGVAEVRMSVRDGDNVVIDTTAYYAGSLVPQDGTVTPALSEAVVKPSFTESAPKAGDAIVVTTEDVHLTASAKPGLHYTLKRAAAVNGTYEPVAGSKVQAKAEDATVSFDIKKGGASSAFFKVEVSDR